MTHLFPSGRSDSRLRLKVHNPDEPQTPELPDPLLHWAVAAGIAGAGAAFVGWVLITAVATVSWFTAQSPQLADAIRAGTHFWLLANGAGLSLGTQRWTLMPLGITVVLMVMVASMASFALRQALLALGTPGVDELSRGERSALVRNITLVSAGAYTASVTITASLVGTTNQGARALVGSGILALIAAYLGVARAAGYRMVESWPPWARAIPNAVVGGVSVAVLAGTAAVVTALIRNFAKVSYLATQITPEPGPGFMVLLIQLIYWPNLVLWAASWVLGAGFRIGQGSLVSPSGTDLGFLPAIPVFGALPAEGPGSPWLLLWLFSGVVAGIVVAVVMLRARPGARFDELSLASGLAGLVAGLVLAALGMVSGGDLGTERMTGLGPRTGQLALMGGVIVGLSAMAAGLAGGLLRRPRAAAGSPETPEKPHDEPPEPNAPFDEPPAPGEPPLDSDETPDDDELTELIGPEPPEQRKPKHRWFGRGQNRD